MHQAIPFHTAEPPLHLQQRRLHPSQHHFPFAPQLRPPCPLLEFGDTLLILIFLVMAAGAWELLCALVEKLAVA